MDRDRPGPGGGAGNRDELGTRLIGSWVKVAKAPGVHEDVPSISWRQSSSVTAPDGWLCARTMAAAWSESAGAKTARRNRQMHEVTAVNPLEPGDHTQPAVERDDAQALGLAAQVREVRQKVSRLVVRSRQVHGGLETPGQLRCRQQGLPGSGRQSELLQLGTGPVEQRGDRQMLHSCSSSRAEQISDEARVVDRVQRRDGESFGRRRGWLGTPSRPHLLVLGVDEVAR
jgi:hypothetical protein